MSVDGFERGRSAAFSRVILMSERHLRVAFDKLGGDVRVHIEAGDTRYDHRPPRKSVSLK